MKHYPLTVAGEKAAGCIELHWNTATVSVKFSHRKGQVVNAAVRVSNKVMNQWHDCYDDYTAFRFEIKTSEFRSPVEAVRHCASLINEIIYSINFNSSDDLITKELLVILG